MVSPSSSPSTLGLDEIRGEKVGGKAAGLAELQGMGLQVPSGFVVLGATPERLPADLIQRYRDLGGGRVAVRSSALDEDSADASFAGQYDTILDVEGEEAVREAVVACLQSLSSARAATYRDRQLDSAPSAGPSPDSGDEAPAAMCVVVQRMVDARAAGVLFTVDPVTHRRAHVVIDAVAGLGEALVSGLETPDHYLLDRAGETLSADLVGSTAILNEVERKGLLQDALAAEADRGEPLDLEWAIDADGKIWWLQARPITTLEPDLNELDTALLDKTHVWTRCNVGEMFPGVCTPLSYSFTARAIDVGMQRMHVRVGIQSSIVPEFRFVAMFYGHLFLNLTTLGAATSQTVGGNSDQLCLSLCGRKITEPEIVLAPPPPLPRRVANIARYARYLFGQKQARRRLRELVSALAFQPADGSARAMWQAIDARFSAIFDAMDWHLVSSATAGALSPVLLGILAKGEDPTDANHAELAALLAGAEGVESSDIASGAQRILDRLGEQTGALEGFAQADPGAAYRWLTSADAGAAGREFKRYLARHGHRAIKELELRQPEWIHDPSPVVRSLQVSLRARLAHAETDPPVSVVPSGAGAIASAVGQAPGRIDEPASSHSVLFRWLVRLAHQTVRSREETKSGLVAVTVRFKEAYRELARRAVAEGLLPDDDLVFFLTQEELGSLVAGDNGDLVASALARRSVLDRQAGLQFEDVFVGEPTPITPELPADFEGRAVTGTSVSRGVVVGIARVVHTPEEAEALQEGEILIAPITDVGWTPYFALISGLVTNIGSAVSHGAVVAREFGLPAIVNTRFATEVFKTGDRIVLDGDLGLVRHATADD